jgi:hypothetical protein
MKYRQMFVSNSSSTSFIVAFVPEENNINLKTFDFLLGANGNKIPPSLDVFRSTVIDRRDELKEELIAKKRDAKWLAQRISDLLECFEIPAIQLLMTELNKHHKCTKETLRYKRRDKTPWKDEIIDRIQDYNVMLEEINADIVEAKSQLKLIENLSDETVIAKWTSDNYFGYHVLSDLLDMLQIDGRVKVLEKKTT